MNTSWLKPTDNGATGRAQDALGAPLALIPLRPVMPERPEVAGSASGILWVRFQFGVRLGSAKEHTHSTDTRLAE